MKILMQFHKEMQLKTTSDLWIGNMQESEPQTACQANAYGPTDKYFPQK